MLVAVIVAALVIGAASAVPSRAIVGALRCPRCVNKSAAQANTPAAQTIRADIAAWLRQGQSARQIVAYIRRYGPWIFLKPPVPDMDLVVQAVPGASAAGAIRVLGVAFVAVTAGGGERSVSPLSGEDRACVEAAREAVRPADTPSSNRLGVS